MNKILFTLIIMDITLYCLGVNAKSRTKLLTLQNDPPAEPRIINSYPDVASLPRCKFNGCFGELCTKRETPMTCADEDRVWKEEYACAKYRNCTLVEAECKWVETEASSDCVKALSSDESCWTGGCFGELCSDKPTYLDIEACIWKPQYECLNYSSCGKNNGVCSWETTNQDFQNCYSEFMRNATLANNNSTD